MSFHLTSNDDSFNARVNSLFDSLDAVNKDLSSQIDNEESSSRDGSSGRQLSSKRKFHETEDKHVFAKPFNKGPLRRHCQVAPDYLKNPKNWTCYSLEDTKCASDVENRKIAMELIKTLKKDTPEMEDDGENNTERIQFKKPISSKEEEEHVVDCAVAKSDTKFVLPTYEIGSNSKNKSKPKKKLDGGSHGNHSREKVNPCKLSFEMDDD